MRVEAGSMAALIEMSVPGAVVSPRWWETITGTGTDSGMSSDDALAMAEEQAAAVLASDVLVYLGALRGAGQGTCVELGMAIAAQRLQESPLVIGVGHYESQCIFHRLTTLWVSTWEDVIEALTSGDT